MSVTAQRPVMAALSLPVLSVSETEMVFHKLSAANQGPGGTNIGQPEERRNDELPLTRLQQTLKPKSASSSCHCGHNYLETDDKSLEKHLTNTTSPSRDYLAPSDVPMYPYLSEILILDEIKTNRKDCPEILFSQQKVWPYCNHLNLINCWWILHNSTTSSLFSLWCCQVGASADTRSPVESAGSAESRDNLSEPRSKFVKKEAIIINRERSWSKSPTREFVKNFPWSRRKS